MASRRNRPPTCEEHYMRATEVAHQGPLPDGLMDELARQEVEIERLLSDNRRLASAHLSMRQGLTAATQEAHRIREDIKRIDAEGDVEIRIFLDRIVKLEAVVRGGYANRKELQEMVNEIRSFVSEKMELSEKIRQATRKLEDTRADIKRLPEMKAEIESLRQEHQILRETFELKKGANMEKVEQVKNLETELIHLSEEVERLCGDLSNTEQCANVPPPPPPPSSPPPPIPPPPPYDVSYVNVDNSYPPRMMYYADSYGRPIGQMVGPEGGNQYPYGGYVAGHPVTGAPGWGGGM